MSLSVPVKNKTQQNEKKPVKKQRFRAVVGVYLEVPGEQTKYGVTCRHVTNIADSFLYIENKGKQLIKFGQVLDRQSSVTTGNKEKLLNRASIKQPDIDIFEIDKTFATICRPTYRNENGNVVNFRLYNGAIRDLYTKTLFQCRVEKSDEHKDSWFKANVGTVLSAEEHQQYAVDLEADFIIRGTQGQFATKGHSGNMVAIEVDKNNIEIVGIIKSGEYTNPTGQTDHSVCLCILLSKGIAYLNKEYCKEFTLSVTDNHSLEIGRHIEPGHMILFHRPEDTKPTDFVLTDRLLMLIDVLKIQSTDATPLTCIIMFENDLNEKVYQMKDIECDDYLKADQKCIQFALLACSKVYVGELNQAEKELKKACRMVSCQTLFPLRLLCKVYCYATWLMLEMGQLGTVGQLLEQGIAFMEKHKDGSDFPGDCLGYQYYDHSRFLQTKPDAESQNAARRRAHEAIKVIEDDRRNNGGHAEILALAYANYAHLQLECGEHFDGKNKSVENASIDRAEKYLHKAENTKGSDDSVENVYIIKTWGEFYFRKNDFETAALKFKTGLEKAEQMHLTKESELCRERLEITDLYLLQCNSGVRSLELPKIFFKQSVYVLILMFCVFVYFLNVILC